MSKVNLKKWNYESPLSQKIIDKNYSEFYEIVKFSGAEIIDLNIENSNDRVDKTINNSIEKTNQITSSTVPFPNILHFKEF